MAEWTSHSAAYSSSVLHAAAVSSEAERPMSNVDQPPEGRGGMREVGVEGRWRPLGRGRVGDAVSGGRRRHEGAPEGWSAGGPSPQETGAAPLRKTRFWGEKKTLRDGRRDDPTQTLNWFKKLYNSDKADSQDLVQQLLLRAWPASCNPSPKASTLSIARCLRRRRYPGADFVCLRPRGGGRRAKRRRA